jgi:hypothetical protein
MFKEALAVFEVYANETTARLDFPYALLREIAPLGTASNVRTFAWFKLMVVVPLSPSSTLIDWFKPPVVAVPPREIGPEDTIVIVIYLTEYRMQ